MKNPINSLRNLAVPVILATAFMVGSAVNAPQALDAASCYNENDLLCKINVETPVNLNDAQKKLLRELKTSLGEGGAKHSPRETSWFQGVKDFFDGLTS